jgi:hypothetical protein
MSDMRPRIDYVFDKDKTGFPRTAEDIRHALERGTPRSLGSTTSAARTRQTPGRRSPRSRSGPARWG